MRSAATFLALLLSGLVLAGCSTSVKGTPSAAPGAAVPTTAPSVDADRKVCVDFDARGGALYSVFVVPMMKGASGQKSIDVDIAQMTRATASLTSLDPTSLAEASSDIQDAGERVVAASQALGIYDHTEGTALLTAFVSLGAACQTAGHKPSWFDAQALMSS